MGNHTPWSRRAEAAGARVALSAVHHDVGAGDPGRPRGMPVSEEMITQEPAAESFRYGRPARISSAACPAFSVNVAAKSPGAESARFPPTVPPTFATR